MSRITSEDFDAILSQVAHLRTAQLERLARVVEKELARRPVGKTETKPEGGAG